MLFHRFNPFRYESLRRRMIREHQRWLSKAVRGEISAPRIPVRPVATGGFARMLAKPGGRRQAAEWWDNALQASE